jgi:type IV pilus assembly protein PilB
VFSTLHTNDAPTSITRLKDMGVPTFLITATVEAILAQRLVRRICTQCREPIVPTDDMLLELLITREEVAGRSFFRGKGCEACNNTGYKGRVGLFELMLHERRLRDMIMINASADDLRSAARQDGMVTLRDIGIQSVYEGTSTAEEVIRETVLEA